MPCLVFAVEAGRSGRSLGAPVSGRTVGIRAIVRGMVRDTIIRSGTRLRENSRWVRVKSSSGFCDHDYRPLYGSQRVLVSWRHRASLGIDNGRSIRWFSRKLAFRCTSASFLPLPKRRGAQVRWKRLKKRKLASKYRHGLMPGGPDLDCRARASLGLVVIGASGARKSIKS